MKMTQDIKDINIKTSISPCFHHEGCKTVLPTAKQTRVSKWRQILPKGHAPKLLKSTNNKNIEEYWNFGILKTHNYSTSEITTTKDIQPTKILIPQRIFVANCNPGVATITTTLLYSSFRGAFAWVNNSCLIINTFLPM